MSGVSVVFVMICNVLSVICNVLLGFSGTIFIFSSIAWVTVWFTTQMETDVFSNPEMMLSQIGAVVMWALIAVVVSAITARITMKTFMDDF